MNKDNFEGVARATVGKAEQLAGKAFGDPSTTGHGHYDEMVGRAQSAVGSAKDAIASGLDAAGSIDFSALRDEITKLSQTVGDLVQKQASTTRDQVMGVMGAAGENLSQSATAAQEQLSSIEADVGVRIRKNPWSAVAIAALVGLLIGKMS